MKKSLMLVVVILMANGLQATAAYPHFSLTIPIVSSDGKDVHEASRFARMILSHELRKGNIHLYQEWKPDGRTGEVTICAHPRNPGSFENIKERLEGSGDYPFKVTFHGNSCDQVRNAMQDDHGGVR